MQRVLMAAALAAALLAGGALPAAAQQNGLVIQNNGVDSVDSAAGADNVRISRNPGNSSSNNGAGSGNEERRVVREAKDRDRGGRGGRNNAEAAPAEAAPADGGYQEYADQGSYADPAAVPQEIAAPDDGSAAPIKLPNTGTGTGLDVSLLAAVAAAAAAGVAGLRRRVAG
jgi:LPXTG-motif cell wall-anchored protein